MSGRILRGLLATAIAVLLGVGFAFPAAATSLDERSDYFKFKAYVRAIFFDPTPDELCPHTACPYSEWLHRFESLGATMEPGEPTFGGKMHRTVWADMKSPKKVRVVIDTFGSDFDTVLAVYKGAAVNRLTLVAGNDNKPVPGLSTTQSLVQFDAAANTDYSVQLGSTSNARMGDVYANVFVFPPTGGLSAFLATLDGTPFILGDYLCGINVSNLPPCPAVKFILHNSTSKTLTVTASSNLGAGVIAPGQKTLAPGAVTTAEFTFSPDFDETTPRTVSGGFTFTANAGVTLVNKVERRALIAVKPRSALPDVLKASVKPRVRAGGLNEAAEFDVTLTNSGADPATGCYVRSPVYDPTTTTWQQINPATGAAIAGVDVPATIPAGHSVTLRVLTASQQSRVAYPTFAGSNQLVMDCANTAQLIPDLSDNFDFTARGTYMPVKLQTATLAPTSGIITVTHGTTGSFRVSAVNKGPSGTVIAMPTYEHPIGEPAAKRFTTTICAMQTANGPCLQAAAASLRYTAAPNVVKFFRVFVHAPASNPGFAPDKRRVFLTFSQAQPIGFTYPSVAVAAETLATKWQ